MMLKYRHDTQVLSKVVVSKMVVNKIVETPLTVRRRLVCFHDDESERIWNMMLAPYRVCTYICSVRVINKSHSSMGRLIGQ